jgi:hypothetical protein
LKKKVNEAIAMLKEKRAAEGGGVLDWLWLKIGDK